MEESSSGSEEDEAVPPEVSLTSRATINDVEVVRTSICTDGDQGRF